MLQSTAVKDIATHNVIKLPVDADVLEAIEMVQSNRIHNIIIEESDGSHSVLSLTAMMDAIFLDVDGSIKIGDIPRKKLLKVAQDSTVTEAVFYLSKNDDILGITDADGSLCGVVTYWNVMHHIEHDELQLLSDTSIDEILLKDSAVTVEAGEKLTNQVAKFKHSPTDSVIVVNQQKAWGIITKRDIIRFYQEGRSLNGPVENYMSAPLFTIGSHTNVVSALNHMLEKHFRRAVVEDRNGRHLGVITQKSLVDYIVSNISKSRSISVERMNQMLVQAVEERTKELENYQYNLEQLVEERTRELREANAKLEEEIAIRKETEKVLEKAQQELLESNRQLFDKVEEEVENNRQKDLILDRQSKMAAMGEMISMIAHQWRQPLNAVSIAVSGIQLRLKLNSIEAEYLEPKLDQIGEYVQYMSKTIDDFRNFYKPDKLKETVLLPEVIGASLNIIRPGLLDNDIEVVEMYGDIKPYESYKNELIQVILNLLKNAHDVLVERDVKDAKIVVKAYHGADGSCHISIEDNAGGIEPAIVEKVFDPYFSTKDEKNGTGLGLYMSKRIVEDHCNGNLKIENGEEGARFVITLPEESEVNS
jgi:signal transduction histidine kinase